MAPPTSWFFVHLGIGTDGHHLSYDIRRSTVFEPGWISIDLGAFLEAILEDLAYAHLPQQGDDILKSTYS